MAKAPHTILTASIALALAFTLNACSSSDDDDSGNNNNLSPLSAADAHNEYQRQKYKYYILGTFGAAERCEKGVVEYHCGLGMEEGWYNPLTHFCVGTYDIMPPTYEVKVLEQCGGILYEYGNSYAEVAEQRCQNDTPEGKCRNGEWYNYLTHYCIDTSCDGWGQFFTCIYEVKALKKCGNFTYLDESDWRCKSDIIERRCSDDAETGEWYNYLTHYCEEDYDVTTGTTIETVKPKTLCE
jgi:hypothetical protein